MGSPKAVKRAGDCCPNNPPTIPPNNPPQSLFKIGFGLRGIGGLFIVKNYQALNILLIATIPQAPDRQSLFIIRVSGDCCGGLLGDCWLYNPPGAGSPGGRDPQKTPPAGALAGTRPPPLPETTTQTGDIHTADALGLEVGFSVLNAGFVVLLCLSVSRSHTAAECRAGSVRAQHACHFRARARRCASGRTSEREHARRGSTASQSLTAHETRAHLPCVLRRQEPLRDALPDLPELRHEVGRSFRRLLPLRLRGRRRVGQGHVHRAGHLPRAPLKVKTGGAAATRLALRGLRELLWRHFHRQLQVPTKKREKSMIFHKSFLLFE